MLDVFERLARYKEYADDVAPPLTVDEVLQPKPELEALPPPRWRRSPLAVVVTAAVVALLLIGLPSLFFLARSGIGPADSPGTTAVTSTPPPTTDGTITTTPSASDTSLLQPPSAQPEVSGRWTFYSADHGLPPGIAGVTIGSDGTAWASQLGLAQLYRLEGDQWSPVGDPIAVSQWRWMVATPDGGVAMAPRDGSEGIFLFDGSEWSDADVVIRESAVISGTEDVRVLGYGDGNDLVSIRFTESGPEVTSKSSVRSGGASNITIWNTVDADSYGNAWFGTIEGAWRLDGDSVELFEFGVQGECCAPLAVDARDNVWVLIDAIEGDLFRLSPDGERTRFAPDDGIPFLKWDEPSILLTTSDGGVWVLSRLGAARFDSEAWVSYTATEARDTGIPLPQNASGFGVVKGTDGSTWTVQVGSETEPELHRFFDGQWKKVPSAGIDWGSVGADYGTLGMAVAPDGSLWIPTDTGVARFQPEPASTR